MQRWTKQRRALAALLARGEPMSAQALHEQLLACGEAVSLATVYRALVAMEQEALASRVPGGAGDLWELARAGRMVCARCHRATPLPAAAQTALCGEGFCVQSVQVRGICPACQVQRAQEVPMQEQGKPIIDVVAGFLGSGKTTLIRRLLPVWQAEGSVCIVENEFGDVSIDARVLEDGGSRVVELSSGCICCTLIYDFERELLRILRKYRPQRVVVEPSGVGRLSDIIAALGGKQLGGVFTTGLIAACVDVNRFDAYLKSFADFYADQIRAAGAIFLSRTRGCDPVVLRRALGGVKRLQPHAALISTPWDEVTPQALLAHAMQGEHGSVCACE